MVRQQGAPQAVCPVCPRRCALAAGQTGFCKARRAQAAADGSLQVAALNYGRVTALALDPIEKKPLARFYPGSTILSAGSYGCNLSCWFCQNHDISQCGEELPWREVGPEALAQKALGLKAEGCIGLAFTYNEPAVGYEYVRDAAKAAHALGLKNAMVTNGCFCPEVMAALLPYIDAFNIDLKCFTEAGYQKLGGSLQAVKGSIAAAAQKAHLEVTCLVVPGFNDDEEEIEALAAWLAGAAPGAVLHLSRYFPRWQAQAPPTPPQTMRRLKQVAQRHLGEVLLGNM